MSIRQTSIKAFNEIKSRGLLSQKRQEVYEILFKHGPATAMELRSHFPKGTVDSQIRARLNELRECGCAAEIMERECSVTGMKVILWDVTSKTPTKISKKSVPNRKTLELALKAAIRMCDQLKANLFFGSKIDYRDLNYANKVLDQCFQEVRK